MDKAIRWNLTVEHLSSCNCNWGCPCSFNSPPTYGKCETALSWRIVEGKYFGVGLDGLKWILIASWPSAIHLGNGRGLVLLDSRARGERRDALEGLTTSADGPLAPYMKTIAVKPEVRTAQIEFRFAGKRSHFRSGAAVEVEFEPIQNPVTGEEQQFTAILPSGLLTGQEDFYSAKTFRVKADGFDFSYPSRNAILSKAHWRGP